MFFLQEAKMSKHKKESIDLDNLETEIERTLKKYDPFIVPAIYIGGGTFLTLYGLPELFKEKSDILHALDLSITSVGAGLIAYGYGHIQKAIVDYKRTSKELRAIVSDIQKYITDSKQHKK